MHKENAQIFPILSAFRIIETQTSTLFNSDFLMGVEVFLLILFVDIWILFLKAKSCLLMVVQVLLYEMMYSIYTARTEQINSSGEYTYHHH